MTEQINLIYEKWKSLLGNLESIVQNLHRQRYYEAYAELMKALPDLEMVLGELNACAKYFDDTACDVSEENVLFILNTVLDNLEKKEYVLLADVIEQVLLPWAYAMQETIVARELPAQEFSGGSRTGVNAEKGQENYVLEYTSCGLPTVRVEPEGFYLHSNRNAITEARALAEEWYKPDAEEYLVFGMGLGYVVEALLQKSEYITVQVFESDETIVELADKYGVSRSFPGDRVSVCADVQGIRFAEAVRENPTAEVCFFYPSIRMVRDTVLKERLEDTFIRKSSERGQYPQLIGNFKKNIENYDAPADELKEDFTGKRVYLVGAGPSLDNNISLLNRAKKNGIVVAAGTVLKKLLQCGIRPDYVVATDAKKGVFAQVEGILDAGIPVLGLSTAYYRYFTDYHAKHYLLCQEGFAPAEEYAAKKGYRLIQTGGSVMTAALSAALVLGAAEIVFVGMDMAYTGGKDHVSGTASVAEHITGDCRMVEDIHGNPVPTAKNLDMYRRYMERQIEGARGVRFVDATEGGARIAGTEIAALADMV